MARRIQGLHRRAARDRGNRGEVRGIADHHFGFGIANKIIELSGRIGGVERQEDRAGPQRSEIEHQPFRRFLDLRGDPQALRDAHKRTFAPHPTQSSGFWAQRGEILSVEVNSASRHSPELWIVPIGSREAKQTLSLQPGSNSIRAELNGVIYFVAPFNQQERKNPIHITLSGGGREMPRFVLGQHSKPDWHTMLQRLERDDESMAAYCAALEADPNRAMAHYGLATILCRKHREAEAIRYFERALALEPEHVHAMLGMAGALMTTGRHAEAIALCRKVIATQPDFARARNVLGIGLAEIGDIEAAVAESQRAVALAPDRAEFCFNLAQLTKIRRGDQMLDTLEAMLPRAASLPPREQC